MPTSMIQTFSFTCSNIAWTGNYAQSEHTIKQTNYLSSTHYLRYILYQNYIPGGHVLNVLQVWCAIFPLLSILQITHNRHLLH